MVKTKIFQYYTWLTPKLPNSLYLQEEFFECIIGIKGELPDYLTQDNTSPLENKTGIIVGQDLFATLLTPERMYRDFTVFFFYQLNHSINDHDRYNKEYPSKISIDQLNQEHSIQEQLFYEDTAWSDVLKVNPDLFLVKNREEYLIGAKDPYLLSAISL